MSKVYTDATGRKQMAANVLASWAGQLVFIVAGFVLPHMIDRRLGQTLLGVWDFAWSLVSYFSLVQAGIVGSISRYVAMHLTPGDAKGVNRVASSVACVLVLMAAVISLLTLGAVYLMGRLKADTLGDHLPDARWVVLILGLEIAVQTVASVYGGVITGSHRWGLHNAVTAISYLFAASGMIAVLFLGGGLRLLALVHLSGEVGAALARCFFAHRVLPKLQINFANAERATALEMLRFGTKSWAPSIGDLILNQTTSILIVGSLGPASLAVYSRSRSLVRYTRDLIVKMAAVLVASVSSLHASGDQAQIRELVIKSTRYSAFLAFPGAMLLVICGGPLLSIWMGSRYAASWVVALLAIGQTAAVLQLPMLGILAGMNRHGRLSIVNMFSSLLAVLSVAGVLLWAKQGLFAVAVAVVLPSLIVNAIYAPIHACRRVGLPVAAYFNQTILYALIRTLPFALCLMASRWILPDRAKLAVLLGCASGGAVLIPIYWFSVVPPSLKTLLLQKLGRRKQVTPVGSAPAVP